jgi:hypothetical protein
LLGRSFHTDSPKRSPTEFFFGGSILAEKLSGRSFIAEHFVWILRKRCFQRDNWKISLKGTPARKFPSTDPLHVNSHLNSSMKTCISSTFVISKPFEEIVSESILRNCFSYNISLYACFLTAISFWEKWCCDIFFQRDVISTPFAETLFWKKSFCKIFSFPTDSVLELLGNEICLATSCFLT